jgi:hypothetical protein
MANQYYSKQNKLNALQKDKTQVNQNVTMFQL